ncbi:MAG TPA: exodeoxyribonuclease VII small subunit [Ruminiclostridium sp.]|jgi:exodeoxyribonuclease VII small subunit|uniref:Exodeoxyribonuclease 7 small subunit n=1 Tax=Acetivibrio saccincola TaxID=1677857 RepID=A0A2K9EQ94_9FIRM|nr:exodeoxyribonuclease VII small subunit [Acetivibrio saccincola]HAA42838.1 exodeoxyribonuclease VII small subunit [Ruminiclostridium sp.]AUG57660.1 Exodeoxyribonuclease 7 small subunit [Acetivibrio saccincola]NLW26850.1 exodeoxyribonuclease VII small subunit [Acetivibrio saccincola]HOA97635.1 exodeoxyribonuclease VII small subunit [Acetivibrio saccincola]HQD28441.1 exodeoxyribonuclease VII small subunit [Acetivibrio saccincola]
MGKEKKTFEQSMNELEKIVEDLEKGEMPLETSIEVFQKGVELSKNLSKILDEMERKITILIEKEDGSIKEENFEN